MTKFLNRNHLKIIALLSMLIDHIGYYLLNNNVFFRIIGRLAFPIFAFFIAEGFFYTKNKNKYILLMFGFALISFAPYSMFFKSYFQLNTLFTFFFSLVLIYFAEKLKQESFKQNWFYYLLFALLNIFLIMISLMNLYSYGYIGAILPVVLYFFRNSKLKYLIFVLFMVLLSVPAIISNPTVFINYIQLFSILALPVLMLYNGQKGNLNLKYLFYIFYPIHLIILIIIKSFI